MLMLTTKRTIGQSATATATSTSSFRTENRKARARFLCFVAACAACLDETLRETKFTDEGAQASKPQSCRSERVAIQERECRRVHCERDRRGSAANLASFPSIPKMFLYLALFNTETLYHQLFFSFSSYNSAVLYNLAILCLKILAALVQWQRERQSGVCLCLSVRVCVCQLSLLFLLLLLSCSFQFDLPENNWQSIKNETLAAQTIKQR